MKIGSVKLNNFTILAPLAGITNLPFRLLAKKGGCGLVYSEMVSANGLVHGSIKTNKLLASSVDEKPLSIQIFGSEPDILADAAQILESLGADIIDINFGCSVKKVIKNGSGSALMKNPKKAEAILKKVRSSIKIPLTIKIRSGWNSSGDQAIAISNIAESCGIEAIAIHPRTATQGFKGISNWSIIKKIKSIVKVPVIGNGDIITAYDAIRMRKETKCDFIMIGRAAIGNPFIFKEVLDVSNKNKPYKQTNEDKFNIMMHYLKQSVLYLGEKKACNMMRSRLYWFVKGMKGAKKFRESTRFISSKNQAIELILKYKKYIT